MGLLAGLHGRNRAFDGPWSGLLTGSPDGPMVVAMNGLLAICGICREIMS